MNKIVHFDKWVQQGEHFVNWVFNDTYNDDNMDISFFSCMN